jgi:hypothetical protein
MKHSEGSDANPELVRDLYRLTSDLVLLKHRAMDRPVTKDDLPYLRSAMALCAATSFQMLRDSLESEGEDMDLERTLRDTRVYRAWHILETIGMRPWIAAEVNGPETLKSSSLSSQVEADQAMEDLLGLPTSQLNRLHTEVVLIDEGESL